MKKTNATLKIPLAIQSPRFKPFFALKKKLIAQRRRGSSYFKGTIMFLWGVRELNCFGGQLCSQGNKGLSCSGEQQCFQRNKGLNCFEEQPCSQRNKGLSCFEKQ
jgi:hypothetical protein